MGPLNQGALSGSMIYAELRPGGADKGIMTSSFQWQLEGKRKQQRCSVTWQAKHEKTAPASSPRRHKRKFGTIPDKAIILSYFSHLVVTGHCHKISVNDTALGATTVRLSSGVKDWSHDKAVRDGWLLPPMAVQIPSEFPMTLKPSLKSGNQPCWHEIKQNKPNITETGSESQESTIIKLVSLGDALLWSMNSRYMEIQCTNWVWEYEQRHQGNNLCRGTARVCKKTTNIHYLQLNFSKANAFEKERNAHRTRSHPQLWTKKKKKKGIEKHRSPFYLPIKLSYSENDLFPVSAPSTLPHSLISSHIALSLPGAHQIHFCFETFSAYNIPPQDHHIASSSQPRRFFVGSKHIKSNISKYTHIKWNLLKTRTVELQLTSYNRHFERI